MSNRKLKSDGIRKKIKVNFHEATRKFLNHLISTFYPDDNKMYLEKLSQNFLTSINIKVNKDLLNKTLYDIYEEDLKNNYLHAERNFEIIQICLENEIIREVLFSKYIYLFKNYLNSKNYLQDIHKIMEREDKTYVERYIIHANEYIDYFMSKNPNKRKFPKNRMRKRSLVSQTTPTINNASDF